MKNWWLTLTHINKMQIHETKTMGAILIWYPNKKRESIRKALIVLGKAGFLKLKDYPFGSCEIEKLKEIPRKLTWKDARRIARQPWYLWFKYPEYILETENEKN
jgi:hypothetical protein